MLSGAERSMVACGERCFYCGALVTDPAILWMGSSGTLWLHPPCALDFIVRLTRDVHEYQCLSHASVTGR